MCIPDLQYFPYLLLVYVKVHPRFVLCVTLPNLHDLFAILGFNNIKKTVLKLGLTNVTGIEKDINTAK